MTTTSINTADAKEEFSELINRVAHNKERIVLTRRGKEIAVIIPIEDLHLLQSLQDKQDLQDAVDALKDARHHGSMTLEDFKEQMSL